MWQLTTLTSFLQSAAAARSVRKSNKYALKSTCKWRKPAAYQSVFFLVGEGGFEPPKALPADLQSVPFGHSGIPPYSKAPCGAGGRTRTPDLLITNQLLYRLSYTSILPASPVFRSSNLTPERFVIIANRIGFVNLYFWKIEKICQTPFSNPLTLWSNMKSCPDLISIKIIGASNV